MTASDLAKATSVPEDVIALKFGIKTKPIAGQEEPTTLHGFMAAQAALEDAAIPADDVDLVIWCGAQHKVYPCWLQPQCREQTRSNPGLEFRYGSHVRFDDGCHRCSKIAHVGSR